MKDMMKMKMSKKEGQMPEHEKKAKMSVLSELRDIAQKAMGGKLQGMKKVSVMSDSPEGLKKGLEKAEEIVEGQEEVQPGEEEIPSEESEEEMSSEEELSPEQIDQKIKELEMLKAKLMMG